MNLEPSFLGIYPSFYSSSYPFLRNFSLIPSFPFSFLYWLLLSFFIISFMNFLLASLDFVHLFFIAYPLFIHSYCTCFRIPFLIQPLPLFFFIIIFSLFPVFPSPYCISYSFSSSPHIPFLSPFFLPSSSKCFRAPGPDPSWRWALPRLQCGSDLKRKYCDNFFFPFPSLRSVATITQDILF